MNKTKSCVICNTPLKYRQKVTCSHKCLGVYQAKIGNITFQCPICGKEKTLPKYRVLKEHQKTCSAKCGKLLLSKNKISVRKEYTCLNCQKKFVRYPSTRRGKNFFCSVSCHHEWSGKVHEYASSNNPAWKGGISPIYKIYGSGYLFTKNEPLRKFILKRDGYKCVSCGSTKKLHRHHIDLSKTNNEPSNLITLCSKCHVKVHSTNVPT